MKLQMEVGFFFFFFDTRNFQINEMDWSFDIDGSSANREMVMSLMTKEVSLDFFLFLIFILYLLGKGSLQVYFFVFNGILDLSTEKM